MESAWEKYFKTNINIITHSSKCTKEEKAQLLPIFTSLLKVLFLARKNGLFSLYDILQDLDSEVAKWVKLMLDEVISDDKLAKKMFAQYFSKKIIGKEFLRSIILISGMDALVRGNNPELVVEQVRPLFAPDEDMIDEAAKPFFSGKNDRPIEKSVDESLEEKTLELIEKIYNDFSVEKFGLDEKQKVFLDRLYLDREFFVATRDSNGSKELYERMCSVYQTLMSVRGDFLKIKEMSETPSEDEIIDELLSMTSNFLFGGNLEKYEKEQKEQIRQNIKKTHGIDSN